VLLLARAWRPFVSLIAFVAAQMAFIAVYFGHGVLRAYFVMLLHSAGQPGTTELDLSPIQMHSLRSFWALLIPSSFIVWILYFMSSIAVLAMAAAIWKSPLPLCVRFSFFKIAHHHRNILKLDDMGFLSERNTTDIGIGFIGSGDSININLTHCVS
jgi:hypothetical protein